MDWQKILQAITPTTQPIGFSGCKKDGNDFGCCDYDITIFDNSKKKSIQKIDDNYFTIHHGSLKETQSNILCRYLSMDVISDEKWELRTFLSNLLQKKEKIIRAFTKDCLVQAAICATKSKEYIKKENPFAACWVKCSAFFLADAILLYNGIIPSPTHSLQKIRELEKNQINQKLSVVNESIGIERATPSLLSRMCKSTMGFSDMTEDNGHSELIQKKYSYFLNHSLFSDCYFYLGYLNRDNFMKISQTLHRKPELIHILKVAFDMDADQTKIQSQTKILHEVSNDLISKLD